MATNEFNYPENALRLAGLFQDEDTRHPSMFYSFVLLTMKRAAHLKRYICG